MEHEENSITSREKNRNIEGLVPDSVLQTAANTASRMLHRQEKGRKRKESDSYQHRAEEDTHDGRLSLARAENLSSDRIYK